MGKLGDSDILVEKWQTGTIYKEEFIHNIFKAGLN